MKLTYVGTKPQGSTAFKAQTGITWFPGDSHDIKDDVAAKMLKHLDVFQLAEAFAAAKPAAAKTEPTEPAVDTTGLTLAAGAKVEAPAKPVYVMHFSDGTTKTLDGLDKKTLHLLAKEHAVTVHPNAGAATVAAKLAEAFAAA